MLNFAIVVARRKNRAVDINAMKCVAMTGITSAHWSAIAYSTVRSTNVISFVIKAYVNDVWLQVNFFLILPSLTCQMTLFIGSIYILKKTKKLELKIFIM